MLCWIFSTDRLDLACNPEPTMQNIQPYLNFNRNCAEAMRFYERVLGGKLDLLTFGATPGCAEMGIGEADKGLIMHACLTDGPMMLMASDTPPGMTFEPMKGFGLALNYPTVEEATRIFNTLAEGGQVKMPLGETFWSELFGMVTDRFGTPWLINGGEMKTLPTS
jgi:PhnB protein